MPLNISPNDRLPTFAEVRDFDAGAAWDRLTPEQQRAVGVLAVRLGVVGQRLNFEHDFTFDQLSQIEALEDKSLQEFYDGTEPLWARLFGWVSARSRVDASFTAVLCREVSASFHLYFGPLSAAWKQFSKTLRAVS